MSWLSLKIFIELNKVPIWKKDFNMLQAYDVCNSTHNTLTQTRIEQEIKQSGWHVHEKKQVLTPRPTHYISM